MIVEAALGVLALMALSAWGGWVAREIYSSRRRSPTELVDALDRISERRSRS